MSFIIFIESRYVAGVGERIENIENVINHPGKTPPAPGLLCFFLEIPVVFLGAARKGPLLSSGLRSCTAPS